MPMDIPSTATQLEDACSNLENYKDCMMERLRACGSDNFDALAAGNKDLSRLIATSTEICQKDSPLHTSYVQNIACMKATIEADFRVQSCRDYTKKALEYLDDPIERKNTKNDDNHFFTYSYCLRPLFVINCYATKSLRECGPEAKDLAIELIQKAGSVDEQCPANIRIDILDLLQTLESETQEEMYVKRLLTFKLL
ncbi:uncharacterized protein CEXT_508641 [Caerostris extrusa]|uniref:Uncharacterized protein n=1 Tax=Caerostris extrusa TaxID=172846 RepID=A0AAV4T784_CAEEX|nr:uncharacterized protein CEXT_508641 [Caerostris extrusa]